jgi:DnaJ family protein A protein 2
LFQLALAHHPDKVAESDRAAADVKFKSISQAYEILHDDEKRNLYDTHGMAAFDSSRQGMGGGAGMDDILAQMFGMGGGMPGGFGGHGGPKRPRRGRDEEQAYEITLEDLYKGKNVKFQSEKNVICSQCQGKGGKENAKSKSCETCHGQGLCLAWLIYVTY